MPRMNPEQVGEMAVTGLGFLEFLAPFHEAAIAADFGPGEAGAGLADGGGEIVVDAEFAGGFEGVAEEVPDDFLVHRSAHGERDGAAIGADEAVFRGSGGTGNEVAGFGFA